MVEGQDAVGSITLPSPVVAAALALLRPKYRAIENPEGRHHMVIAHDGAAMAPPPNRLGVP